MVFTKGQQGWNKGNRIKGKWLDCTQCGTTKWFVQYRLDHGGGKFCSRTCSNRKRSFLRGPEHWNYKPVVGYHGVHSWLQDNFPKPVSCEKCGVLGKKNKGGRWNIQWALLHGKEYERKVENFWRLCARCHMHYDQTIPYASKGVPVPPERRRKISEGLKRYFASL